MAFNDEELLHIDASLAHLMFARDVIWRTGMLNELHEEGWAYGYDWDGDNRVVTEQFRSLSALFAPDLTTDVQWVALSEPDDMINDDLIIDNRSLADAVEADRLPFDEYVLIAEFIGDQQELNEWQGFINMLDSTAVFGRWGAKDEPHLLWLFSYGEEINAWYTWLGAWELKTYYEHIGHQPAWRAIRGSVDADSQTRCAAEVGNHNKRHQEVQNGELDATAADARSIDHDSAPTRWTSSDLDPTTTASHAVGGCDRNHEGNYVYRDRLCSQA